MFSIVIDFTFEACITLFIWTSLLITLSRFAWKSIIIQWFSFTFSTKNLPCLIYILNIFSSFTVSRITKMRLEQCIAKHIKCKIYDSHTDTLLRPFVWKCLFLSFPQSVSESVWVTFIAFCNRLHWIQIVVSFNFWCYYFGLLR